LEEEEEEEKLRQSPSQSLVLPCLVTPVTFIITIQGLIHNNILTISLSPSMAKHMHNKLFIMTNLTVNHNNMFPITTSLSIITITSIPMSTLTT